MTAKKTFRAQQSPEDQVHIPVLNLIRKHVTRFVWHTPNGGKRGFWEGFHLKDLGMRAGVSDLAFVVEGRAYFLEIKAPGGSVQPNQLTFGREAEAAGAKFAIVRSKGEAVTTLIGWGLLPPAFAERLAA